MNQDDDGFTRVLRADRIGEGQMAVARLGVRQIAVVRQKGALSAFRNTCPHAGSPLSGGHLTGGSVQCPRHHWRFHLTTGACIENPLYSLKLYEVRERDGWIEVRDPEPEIW